MDEQQITLAIAAGLDLYAPRSDAHLPYNDGLFFLKQLLMKLNAGQYALVPLQLNAEGVPVPPPTESPND